MSTYIVTPSTSVVLIDTASLAAGESAIVLLSSQTPPGRNVTIRDSLGYLSTPQSIIISTTQNIFFADGTSSIKTSHPFTTLSFVSRDANTWNIINTFGFPSYDTVANVNSLSASTINGTTLQLGGEISTNTIIANSMYLTSSSQILGTAFVSTLVVGTQDANIVTPGYSAYIVGSSYLSSNAVIGGNLNVNGVSQFRSSITVGGSLSVRNGLTIGGDITVQGNFQTLGNGQLQCGSANIQSSLTVLGTAIFNSNVVINSNLTVAGNTTTTTVNTSTLNIGGNIQLSSGPTLQGRADIIPGQITAAWNSPLYTSYLSTNNVQTTGNTRTNNLQVATTITAPTLTQFTMSSATIQNRSGNLIISSIVSNTLTLSNTFVTSNLAISSLYVSSASVQNSIICANPLGFISSAALFTSSIQTAAITTGSIQAGIIETPAVSVSSLTVAQTIIGGPAFSTFSIPNTTIQNATGSIITSSIFTTSLSASTLNMTSGLFQSSNMTITAPIVYMNALNVSSITASTIQVSTLTATQITIGATSSNLGPSLSPVFTSSVIVTGGPGDYLTPYFLSNVRPAGQNPSVAYNPTANYTAQYTGTLPPGLQITYSATLFWAGQSASFLNIGNGTAILYGSFNSDQTVTGTLTQSTFQLQGTLYGNSAINVTFGYQYSPNVNSIDSNSVLEFNSGILRWNYALNGTTIQNSLNDISTRNLYYYGGLQFASDPRLKENITDANLKKCYDTIESLPLRRYKYIDSYCSTFQVKDTYRLGFLATDLLPHFPKSVHESDTIFPEFSTSLLTIDTSQLEMAHLGATKYLMEEVAYLEKILVERLGKKMPWVV